MPNNFYSNQLSDIKPSFLKLLGLIVFARKNSLGKIGETALLIRDLTQAGCEESGNLKDFLPRLKADGIIAEINDKLSIKKTISNKACFVINCLKNWEEIQAYLLSLHNPGSLGLSVQENGKVAKFANETYRFEERDAFLLNFLCEHAGSPVLASDVIRSSAGIFSEKKQVAVSISNIKLHFKNNLRIDSETLEEILPRGSKGSYQINLTV